MLSCIFLAAQSCQISRAPSDAFNRIIIDQCRGHAAMGSMAATTCCGVVVQAER